MVSVGIILVNENNYSNFFIYTQAGHLKSDNQFISFCASKALVHILLYSGIEVSQRVPRVNMSTNTYPIHG